MKEIDLNDVSPKPKQGNGWGGPRVSKKPKKPKPPNERQQAILAYIVRYKTENQGASPAVRQIMRGVGVPSTSCVTYSLARLADRGYIELAADGRRALDIRIPGAKWVAPEMEASQ